MNIGLIFGMIVAIFTIMLIFVFGFEQLWNVKTMQEKAEIRRNLGNLENAVDRVYNLAGETSDRLTLTFPDSVVRVCFVPMYRGMDVTQKKGVLEEDVRDMLGSSAGARELAKQVVGERIKPTKENPAIDVDHGQTVLLFYDATDVPEWYYIEHLEPTNICIPCGDSYGNPVCVKGSTTIWLQRSFDESGAWVDVREA